jgi:hypothetical protein
MDLLSLPWDPGQGLSPGPGPVPLDVPEWVMEARAAFLIATGVTTARERARLLLTYAYALRSHLGNDFDGQERAVLDSCLSNLRCTILENGSAVRMREHTAAVDEQLTFIEVGLQLQRWFHTQSMLDEASLGRSVDGADPETRTESARRIAVSGGYLDRFCDRRGGP